MATKSLCPPCLCGDKCFGESRTVKADGDTAWKQRDIHCQTDMMVRHRGCHAL